MDYCQTRLNVKRRICESAESDKRETLENIELLYLSHIFNFLRILGILSPKKLSSSVAALIVCEKDQFTRPIIAYLYSPYFASSVL